MVVPLNLLPPGGAAVIVHIEADQGLRRRLAALDLRVGKELRMVRCAPFGGPLHVDVGLLSVALRRDEASRIQVATIDPEPGS